MPPVTTTSCGRPKSSFLRFLAFGNIEKTRSSRRAADHHEGAEQRRPATRSPQQRQRRTNTFPGVLHEVEGEANRPANPHLAPSGTYQPTAPRRARRIRECADQNRSSAAYRQGRLRTQPADCRTEQDADHHRVRAEQDVLPAGAERTAIRRRYAGTAAANATTKKDISNECTERTGPGISRTRQVDSAEKSATNPGMRRPEQVISGLPPGPAANATRGPPRRAERRPPPSPRRAVHLGPKDTERNAIRRRYARAPVVLRDPPRRTLRRNPPSVPAPESSGPTRWRTLTHHHAPSVPRTDPAPSAAHAEIHWSQSRAQPSRSHQPTGPDAVLHAYRPVNAPTGTPVTYAPSGNIEKTTRLTRRAADPAGGRRAHHDFETVRRNADRIRHAPRRTSSRTRRAYRPQNLSSPQNASPLQTRADHPGPVNQRSSPHTQTRITRPDQPAPSVPAPETPPRKRSATPGNKRPESGV